MADNLTTTTTVATIPNATKVKTYETTNNGHKQVVNTSTLIRPSANFTRPADTTAYTSGDLVANSTTAGSVVALSWTVTEAMTAVADAPFMIRRCKIKKTTTSTTNAAFRLHIFGTDPTAASGVVNGDNGAFSIKDAAYLGYFDVPSVFALNNCAIGIGAPQVGAEIGHVLGSGQTLYGLIEVRGAYTPGNAEVFTVELEVWQL